MITKSKSKRGRRTEQSSAAVGYIRVSTAHQLHGVSIDAQRAAIAAECLRRGLTLKSVHTDAGVSGRKRDRPALRDALQDAMDSQAAIVVYSLSRLARSAADALQIIGLLDARGCAFVSCSEQISTEDACGRMITGMLAVVAQFQAEITAETITDNLAHIRSQGRRTGGSVPFGFTASADGRLHPDEREQGVLRRIWDLHKSGTSIRKIATTLDSEGLGPRGERSDGSPSSGRWQPRQVHRLLQTMETSVGQADRLNAAGGDHEQVTAGDRRPVGRSMYETEQTPAETPAELEATAERILLA